MAIDYNIKNGGAKLQADGTTRTWSSSNRIAARRTVTEKNGLEDLLAGLVAEMTPAISALRALRGEESFKDLLQEYEILVSVSQKAPSAEPEVDGGQITLSSREELEELEEEEEEEGEEG